MQLLGWGGRGGTGGGFTLFAVDQASPLVPYWFTKPTKAQSRQKKQRRHTAHETSILLIFCIKKTILKQCEHQKNNQEEPKRKS